MRSRIFLLFLFASLLGMPVLLHNAHRQSACVNLDADTCSQVFPDPFWVRPMGVLSLLVIGYASYALAVAWSERRNERNLLGAVGVNVRDEDLPLEE